MTSTRLAFLMLLYFAVFSVASARERHWFWATTKPSKTFLSAIAAEALTGTILTRVRLPGLPPLPWLQTLAIFAYALVSCLSVNDALKVWLIKMGNDDAGDQRSLPKRQKNCPKRRSWVKRHPDG